MSGGHFEHNQYKIDQIAEDIKSDLEFFGKEKDKSELYMSKEWYEKYPEEKFNIDYADKTKEKFKKAYNLLKEAFIYAHRIDWLMSGDDDEDTFHERLQEDLENIEKTKL